jgi:2'-5' RNA ligase
MRCFVAIRPPLKTAQAIERCVDAIRDSMPRSRRVPTANLHLTLAFIGTLAVSEAAAVAAALRAIDEKKFPPFTWTLDRIGRFPAARVVWIGGEYDPRLDDYTDVVRSLLRQSGVPFDERPFAPHMTVLRNVRSAAPLPSISVSVPWSVARPTLMQSIQGADGVHYIEME